MGSSDGGYSSVLIADDDALVRLVLRMAIAKNGHRVVEVPNGDALLAQVAESAFDLCIMDASMPGPSLDDRLDLLQQAAPEMAVMVISGHAEAPESVARTGSLFMSKPIELGTLTNVLTELGIFPARATRD